MKLCKLKIKNLNSFREEIEVDFEKPPLDDASLVAITGPTGAGKTTLLDAICVALYGKTPRLTGRDTQNPKHLISHGENEAFAEVYFEANSKRYHAIWTIKRTIKRDYPPKTQLFDGSGELITTNVSQEIESVLGLDFAAFKRSVMLAQGEFAAFLKAKDEERRTILEAAASVDIYDELKKTLNDKAAIVKTEYQNVLQKLEAVPEASPEQLAEAETELGRLHTEAKKLGVKDQRIQEQKDHETERKDDFETLQSSEEKLGEFTEQQPVIDERKSELERAEHANQLRPEKQAYDSAKSDYEKAAEALQQTETELADAQKQVESAQTDFKKKEDAYLSLSTDRDQKMEIYTEAKSYIARSEEKFAEVDKRTPTLESLNKQIDTSSSELAERKTRQAELQEQIAEAKTFLDENPLPSDRQARFIRVTALQVEINAKYQQQEGKTDDELQYRSQIDELVEKTKELYEDREKLQSEKETAETSRIRVETEFKELQDNGTLEDWQTRRNKARKAQPIAQQYGNLADQLCDKRDDLAELQENIVGHDDSLKDIEKKLEIQSQLCKRADAEVEKLEAEKELALLAEPVNTLRQQLEIGEPCRVCGATDHPYADKVEHESEALLESIEKALDGAETEAKKTQKQKQKIEQKQARLQQSKSIAAEQVDERIVEIENLNSEIKEFRLQWQELYESMDISSEWVNEKFSEADTSIDNLNADREAYNKISNELNQISQELATCERDHQRESKLLNNTKQELETVTDEIEDLKVDIAETEKSFWASMPDVFHGITPDAAVKQFDDKIKAVDLREQELNTKNSQLKVLNTEIQANQRELNDLNERRKGVEVEINRYQNERETFLDAVREKTDGLETEDQINAAVSKLDAELQTMENARDEAKQQLEENRTLFTEKETAQEFREEQLKEKNENFEAARDLYFHKLDKAEFESSEAHDKAFRDEEQMRQITEQINEYTNKTEQLEVKIVALRTQFEDTPFDPDVLGQITTVAEEIAAEIQGIQQNIGAQEQKIKDLKNDLQKREELDSEVHAAKQEMERWKNLQEIIPENKLRDFALDIMFKQVSRIANVQLAYLTSERYQLDVETIGKLTVIDRWNANEKRPVETLSGGESFLTSLALALALSELSQGRAQLNSLFLDEGFGTLDAETLDIAIAALEGLRMQGRSIYLISHVQELTRRLPVKIKVKKRGDGSSYIEIRD